MASARRARDRDARRRPARTSRRRSTRPSTSGAISMRSTARPRSARASASVENTPALPAVRDPRRSTSSAPTAIKETPPSGDGASTAPAPRSRASNARHAARALGGTSPPTSTAEPPSAATRRALSSRRCPKERPRCAIQAMPRSDGRRVRQAARSSAGAATTSRAPARSAASSHPVAKEANSSAAPLAEKPFARASREGSRAKRMRDRRTRDRVTTSILRRRGQSGFPVRAEKRKGRANGPPPPPGAREPVLVISCCAPAILSLRAECSVGF